MQNKISDYLDVLFDKPRFRGLYINGTAGTGKSYEVYKYLENKNINYLKVTARVSSLALYNLLYDNKEQLIIFDDVTFDKDVAIDILKGALNDDGLVSWYTTSNNFDAEKEKKFIFTGKIIIISNSTLKQTRTFYPLLSRCYTYEKLLNYKEFKDLVINLCQSANEKPSEILRFVNPFLEHFDVRVILKAIDLLKHNKDISDLFKYDNELLFIYENRRLDKPKLRVNWCIEFGKSKRSFYRKFKEYTEKVGVLE